MNKATKVIIPSFIIMFSLQSCFVAKNYERPDFKNELYFRTDYLVENAVAQDTATIADIPWQEMFQDAYLQGYINRALAQNVDIRVALQNILISQAYVKQGKAGYLPTLSANAGYTRSILSENTTSGALANHEGIDQYELGASLSWEADIWGKIRSNYRAANATYLQSIAAHQAVRTQLIASVAATYYQLLALDEQRKVVEETIENRTQSLQTTQALKDAGTVTQVAVNQTAAQLLNAQAQLIDINNNIKLFENTLSLLIGEEGQAIQRSSLDSQQFIVDLRTGIPAQILANRPDVVAAEFALVNAFELTNVARSSLYPSLRITANGGFQSMDFEDLFDAKSTFLNLVGSLTQPIFNARTLRTQLEAAKSQQEIALIQYEYNILNACKEVSDALYTYEIQDQIIDLKQKEFENYDQAIQYSEELLTYGMANYLEVLTARENALSAQLSVINAQYTRLNAIIQLYRAVGGGWK